VVFDSSFAGARPTTTYEWFYNMYNLQSITGMKYLNTSEVTNMGDMFAECSSLTSLDLSNFNTAKVTRMTSMFYKCSSLTSLDLSSFNTSKVEYVGLMFRNCSSLQTIYVGDGWNMAAVTYDESMFVGCTSLEGGQGTVYDADYVIKTYAHIDGGASNPGYFTKIPKEAYACYTSENTTLTFYCDDNRTSRPGTTYDLNTGSHDAGWDIDGTKSYVTKVVFSPSFADACPTSTFGWFYEMEKLQSIEGISHLNTSKVTNMSYMFYYCSSLASLDLSSFNTSKVTDMDNMFGECSDLHTIYVGDGWNTAAVTYSSLMFTNCTSLVGVKGTTWSSSNPTDKTYAHIDGGTSNPGYFCPPGEAYACYTSENTTLTFYYDHLRSTRLNTYDLNTGSQDAGWDKDGTKSYVTKVVFDSSFADARPTSTFGWFYEMENLQTIEGISYLNTSEVTNMAWMFSGCNKLTYLDLNRFNTSEVTDMNSMFYLCTSLRTIYVGDGWNTEAVMESPYMFQSCPSLVGGKGTTWTYSNPIDKTYAHIDGGPSNPGYFTALPAGIATDIENVQRDADKVQSSKVKVQSEEWFTIDGQKLSGKPTKKGVYIQNGKKTVVH
jgi:surface protein